MKKNFFKKLALVMALTLTVTSIPANSASAAAKPGFKSTAVKVNVDQTKKYSTANSAKYSVSFKIGNKSVATIKYSKGSKSVKVTGVAAGKTTLRADFKSYKTKKVTTAKVPVTVAEVALAVSGKQAGAKTIELTATKALAADTKITVKKGNIDVALAEKDGTVISTDGKKVILTSAAKLTAGDYTVTVGDLTCTVKAEDELVASIKFLSDKAVLQAKAVGDTVYKNATASYKVYNQFEEDVTTAAKASITVTGNGATLDGSKDGTVLFTSTATNGYNLNDVVAAVVIYRNNTNVVTQTGTFTISNEAVVAEITVKDVAYNEDKKVLTEDTDFAKDDFYILFSAKDQYGNDMTDLKADATGANIIINFAGGITNLNRELAPSNKVRTLKVDGTTYLAVKLLKDDVSKPLSAGNATLILVSTGNGKTVTATTPVAVGGKIDTISLQFNNLVVGGENTEVSYTALDASGKAVTSYKALKDVTGVLTEAQAISAGKGLYAKEDVATGTGKLYYKATSAPTIDTMDVITLMTKTYKSSNYTVTIKKDAVATAITGTKDLTTGKLAIAGQNFSIKKANVVVVDQYGRKGKVADGSYDIKATAASGSAISSFDTALNGATITTAITPAVGTTSGTRDVKFELVVDSKTVSEYTVTFTAATQKSIKSYTVEDLKPLYNKSVTDSAYAQELAVKGLLSNGTKISIPASHYNVVASSKIDVNGTTKKLTAHALYTAAGEALEKEKSITEKITVIINETGDEFTKEVVLSKEDPKPVSVSIIESDPQLDYIKLGSADEVTLANVFAKLTVKDQYGVELEGTGAATYADTRLTLSVDERAGLSVTANGTKSAATSGLNATDSVTVKLTFADGTIHTFKASRA